MANIDYTGATIREFITGVEFQMQLSLGLHFDCFIWAVTILRSQRYSQDITLIGSSIISTIFSFEHIKFRDKHQRVKILLKILLSSSSSIHAFMTAIMTMTMIMVMTVIIKLKMWIFVLMIISSLHSFISGSLHNWRPKAVSTKLFLASQASILQITQLCIFNL